VEAIGGRRRAIAILLGCVLLLAGAPSQAADRAPTEDEVKAAFLYSFAKFIEWPPDAFPGSGAPFVITTLGDDAFAEILDAALRGKTIRDRRLSVRRVARAEDVDASHILFIGDSEAEQLARILKQLDGAAILTVGDMDHFAERGGVVNFRTENNRVRFEINLAAAEKARLKISSQLLKLARIVGPRAGD
jgi:hypothetical protein